MLFNSLIGFLVVVVFWRIQREKSLLCWMWSSVSGEITERSGQTLWAADTGACSQVSVLNPLVCSVHHNECWALSWTHLFMNRFKWNDMASQEKLQLKNCTMGLLSDVSILEVYLLNHLIACFIEIAYSYYGLMFCFRVHIQFCKRNAMLRMPSHA